MQIFNVDFERRMRAKREREAEAAESKARAARQAAIEAQRAGSLLTDEGREALRLLPVRIRSMVVEACHRYDVKPEILMSSSRARKAVVPCRNELAYRLLSEGKSATRIGKWLGRDHTTVLHGAAMHARKNDLPQVGNFDIDAVLERNRRQATARWKRIRSERAAA